MSGNSTPYMIEENFLNDDQHNINQGHKEYFRVQCEDQKLIFEDLSSQDSSYYVNTSGHTLSPLEQQKNVSTTSLIVWGGGGSGRKPGHTKKQKKEETTKQRQKKIAELRGQKVISKGYEIKTIQRKRAKYTKNDSESEQKKQELK